MMLLLRVQVLSLTQLVVGELFAPDPRGTLLDDGTRWGAFFGGEVILDEVNAFASKEVEIVATGFRWTEGPLSTSEGLLFTDTIQDRIYRYKDGVVSVALENAGGGSDDTDFGPGANGLAAKGGKIVACQHGAQRVVALDATTFEVAEVLADKAPADGTPLNSPNDVAIVNGVAYFTDPIYGFLKKGKGNFPLGVEEDGVHEDQPYLDAAAIELGAGVKGVYGVDLKTGAVDTISTALDRPNGVAYFRDLLWVANSAVKNSSWYAFRGQTLVKKIHWSEVGRDLDLGPGLIDGFEFDESTGLLWSSAPGGVVVVDVDQEKVVAAAKFGTNIANLAFDRFGDNPADVFVTGLGHLWRLKRNLPVGGAKEHQEL